MQSVVSGGLRLASLSLRMVLMLFMARYLSFADIGVFSLIVGTTSLLPGAAGLGLSYFVNRQVVGGDAPSAYLLARDRLIVTLLCGIAAAVGMAGLVMIGVIDLAADLYVLGAIIVLEMIGFDLHLLLIARYRAGLANFLMFLRAAAWIPLFMVWAYESPEARNIDVLLRWWLAGEVLFLACAAICLRHIFRRTIFSTAFDSAWLKAQFPRVIPIWASDFSLAVSQNIDRFIISAMIGVEAAGIYYFFIAIASAAFQIVQSATIQPYMPRMRELFREGNFRDLHLYVAASLKKVVLVAVFICCCAGAGTVVLILVLRRPELQDALYLIVPIMGGTLARSINEYLGIVDYVTENDVRYISLNIAALVVSSILLTMSTFTFGLLGAAMAFLTTMSVFAGLRWKIWSRSRIEAI